MCLCATRERRPLQKSGGSCELGRQSDDLTEIKFVPHSESRTVPPGAAGAAALRHMLEQEELLTPTFDREADRTSFGLPEHTLPKDGPFSGCGDGSGRQEWPDGASYEGDYKHGLKHGMGRFAWTSGAAYEGDFVEDRLEGSGCFRWACGSTYEGTWKEGKMDGSGLFTWPDGRSYEGGYRNDFKHGQGIFRWPDGRQLDGQWKDGVQHGIGAFTSASGKHKKAEWRNGELVRGQKAAL